MLKIMKKKKMSAIHFYLKGILDIIKTLKKKTFQQYKYKCIV